MRDEWNWLHRMLDSRIAPRQLTMMES